MIRVLVDFSSEKMEDKKKIEESLRKFPEKQSERIKCQQNCALKNTKGSSLDGKGMISGESSDLQKGIKITGNGKYVGMYKRPPFQIFLTS